MGKSLKELNEILRTLWGVFNSNPDTYLRSNLEELLREVWFTSMHMEFKKSQIAQVNELLKSIFELYKAWFEKHLILQAQEDKINYDI